MTDALISLLVTCIILAIVFGIAWALIAWLLLPRLPAPFGTIITLIFWGLVAIVVILKVLVPLLSLV